MHNTRVLLVEPVTHDVRRYIVEKPEGYTFTPGQATDVSLDLPDWRDQKRPFTFTSIPEDDVLEFTIKSYPVDEYDDHDGMTERLYAIKPGDNLLIDDPWGAIEYKGQGVFIAGGAGITPFLSIFKDLYKKDEIQSNILIYANKTDRDIIAEGMLKNYFDDTHIHLLLSRQKRAGYEHGRVDQEYLKKTLADFSPRFYLCGPPPMVKDLKEILRQLGSTEDSLVFET